MKDDANGYPQGSLVGDCDNKKTYIGSYSLDRSPVDIKTA